ncbi:ABC transporter substrate-binding protein [Paenibacillus sp. L3-i20]|uniref:ABC transporter substrate-binding protein n=1 Tax=Paenibacillus sp. L3-i20 TaxID=2905833 RepID=UPI002852CB5B|nr:ABC transporter substrate-binding protein [Paenibacillus sp. L3-i20]
MYWPLIRAKGTKDLNVRLALSHALDKKTLIDHVFYGIEKQADTLFSSELPYANLPLKPYEFDSSKAASLLDEAGWKIKNGDTFRSKDGQPLEITLAYDSGESVQKAVSEFMQGELRELGVDVKLIGEEYQSHVNRQKAGDFNLIFSETWGVPYDPHSVVASMPNPSHGDYQAKSGLSMKAEIDRKISEVLISTDEQTRAELYTYILTTLHEQAVYLPISFTTHTVVYNKNVDGVQFLPMQYEIPFGTIEVK